MYQAGGTIKALIEKVPVLEGQQRMTALNIGLRGSYSGKMVEQG